MGAKKLGQKTVILDHSGSQNKCSRAVLALQQGKKLWKLAIWGIKVCAMYGVKLGGGGFLCPLCPLQMA